jgi:acetyl-CoA carboxylase carboxyltransferase component
MTLAVARHAAEPERLDLSPLGRIELLCDPGSVHTFRSAVASTGRRSEPGDGVVVAAGTRRGRPVFCYAQDRSFAGGSLGAAQGESIVRLMRMAADARAPVIGFMESGGARVDEGVAALAGYGRIFREQVRMSGRSPQIAVVTGVSAGGGAYAPALADFVVMSRESRLFLTGPKVVGEVMGEDVDAEQLGGPGVHARNGVCHLEAATDADAVQTAGELLDHLPQRSGGGAATEVGREPRTGSLDGVAPSEQRKVYDVRDVIAGLADGSPALELSARYARNVITTIGRIEGRPVGFVANQPRRTGGVLDAASAQKAARFVRTCNTYGLPLVVLVDTPGFLPGTRQEGGGVLRHGAKLLYAFAEAEVPCVTVVLRKAFGGGYIAMNSRALGADLVLAWPGAQIGVLGAPQAVQLMHRRELADADDPAGLATDLEAEYAELHLSAEVAAREGHVDEIVAPDATRRRLAFALTTLGAGERHGHDRGNTPL